jgi:hypothetical protein
MNRQEYLAALVLCFKLETAGAIAGEVAMLLRTDPEEKSKLDAFRRLEACNKVLCLRALQKEGIDRPEIEPDYYRNGIKIGLKLGAGDWKDFLDRFEATIHPELFTAFLIDDQGNAIVHSYAGVDVNLLRHLVNHELCLARFVDFERKGFSYKSLTEMESLLESELCAGLIRRMDPVGW